MVNKFSPFHPVIYVRGFAGTQGEVDETVADPYMGFNIGSTKSRNVGDGSVRRFFFESPLVRLTDEIVWTQTATGRQRSENRYSDVYVDGEDLTAPNPADPTKPVRTDIALPYPCIVIFRYYDDASSDFGDPGHPHPIESFARNLSNLILRLRTLVCTPALHPITRDPLDNGVAPEDFRVYLVAHSMGGLICRAFLQNSALGHDLARRSVDKVFTYATPHNGIDLRIVRNVPGWTSLLGDATNFNRSRMAQFLDLPPGTDDVSEVEGFPPDRLFNLVGTNPADYLVLKGLSSWAVGDESDGLVRIRNATTWGRNAVGSKIESPRAYAFRSHSGHFGIVNSEEGYQNLTRFLFGSVRADGFLEIDAITLPNEVQDALNQNKKLRGSYKFEVVASVRGTHWQLHRRTVRENSAIERSFDELFPAIDGRIPKRQPDRDRSPHLFSIFLDPTKSTLASPGSPGKPATIEDANQPSVAFAFDLAVLVPDYEIDGILWMSRHFEGGYLYRELIIVEARRDLSLPLGWSISYGFQKDTPNLARTNAALVPSSVPDAVEFNIPVSSQQGMNPRIDARLRIVLRNWT